MTRYKLISIPMENKKDLEEIPDRILKKVEVIPVEHMDEVLREALVLKEGEVLFAPNDKCEPFSIESCMEIKPQQNNEVTAH